MSRIDWESLGEQLLERERRPVLLLDPKGRVRHVNRAFLSLLADGSKTRAVDFEREWLAESARGAYAHALKVVRSKGRAHVTVSLVNTLAPLDLVLELVRLGESGSSAVMAVMVDAFARGATLPLQPATGITYEVELGHHDTVRKLTRFVAAKDFSIAPVDPHVPCWRQIFRRTTECPSCPLRGLESGRRVAVLDNRSATFAPWLLLAERHGDRAIVTALPVDEAAWSALMRARVEHVARTSALTPREAEVLSLLTMGRALQDIATAVGITVRMVKYHQQKILKKTGADSRLDLMRLLL